MFVFCCYPNECSGRTAASTCVVVVVVVATVVVVAAAWMVLATFLARLFPLALFASSPCFRHKRNRFQFSVRHLGVLRDR
jgi:predicted branched-subunit amino acid permease